MIKNYEMNKQLKVLIYLSLFIIMLTGCSQNLPTKSLDSKLAPVALRVSLEQSPQLDPIDHLVLTVTASDMDTIRKEISVHNSSFEDTLTVPCGTAERRFELEAKNTEGKTLYSGSASAKVVGGKTVPVEIDLLPAVLMIKLTPRYSYVQQDSVFNLDVEVYGVDSLFGASFRIEFDEDLLECQGADTLSPQGIMGAGDSFIFFDTTGTGYVAVSIIKKFGDNPVSGLGGLAQLSFRALSIGTASLAFSDTTLRLVKADGSSISNFDSLVVDQATVDIVR